MSDYTAFAESVDDLPWDELVRLAYDQRRALWDLGSQWEQQRDEIERMRAALEQIANRPESEMRTARTLHYDMRGWARKALS